MSTTQWVSLAAAVLAGVGGLVSVLWGYATWGQELPTLLAVAAVLGIHPNLPTA